MQKIVPFLWFDHEAEEATLFYTSLFKDSKVNSIDRLGDGRVMSTSFTLNGQQFYALNGGPLFHFTEAVSLFINCVDQAEVDLLWEKLSEGGQKSRCGWLKDKYGLSWQVIPTVLNELLRDKDPAKAGRVMQAMMKMDKIIVADLQKAYDGN